MARKTAAQAKAPKYAEVDDGILDSDSEADEFENYNAAGIKRQYEDSDGDDSDEAEDDSGSEDGGEGFAGIEDSDEEQGDGVGVWEPDNWDGNDDTDSESESGSDDEAAMRKLRKGLKDIPLATVAKAQKALKKANAAAAAGSDSEDEGMTAKERKLAAMKARLAEMQRAKGKASGVVLESEAGPSGRRREREETEAERKKRENKHAPTVMSTKRQVSRNRSVIDVPRADRRDPRFSSLSAGQVDDSLHSRSYSFLPEMLRKELGDLKRQVAVAAKAEKSCKLYEKPRFTAERERLELDLGRVRTRLDRTEREQREREVLSKAKREELEKRKSGKGAWYMKKSEKRDLLLKTRFESLEERGGKGAVKKAMDKKLRKVASKEKKSRPFAAGGGGGGGGGGGDGGGGRPKRRRVA